MPSQTIEIVRKRAGALAEELAAKRAELEPAPLRVLRKRLKRAQRKRRRMESVEQSSAGKPADSAEKAD